MSYSLPDSPGPLVSESDLVFALTSRGRELLGSKGQRVAKMAQFLSFVWLWKGVIRQDVNIYYIFFQFLKAHFILFQKHYRFLNFEFISVTKFHFF